MIALFLLLIAAFAAEVRVITPDGDPVPGRTTRVHVAAVDDAGAPLQGVSLAAERGTVRPDEDGEAAPGVTPWLWTPPPDPGPVVLRVTTPGATVPVSLTVRPLPALDLGVPGRIDSPSGAPVLLRLATADRPPPEDLQVFTSERAEVVVEETGSALEVRITPTGQGARVLLVALSDRRRDTRPQQVLVRLVDRPTLAFEVEPGASLRVKVGGRTYGPFKADSEGNVRAVIEQRPGERSAEILVADELGNELSTPYVLSAVQEPGLLISASRPPRPARLVPDLLVSATTADGRPWTGASPRCQVPGGVGEVPLTPIDDGLWRVSALGSPRFEGGSVRLACKLLDASRDLRLLPVAGVPAAVDLRVGPETLSLDFPVAEVTVHLLDGGGERLSADRVQVSAERGAVRMEPPDGGSRRGEYRAGNEAMILGSDRVVARWSRSTGQGRVADVVVAHGAVPTLGAVRVHGRAVDPDGGPLVGAPITLVAGEASVDGITDAAGWFSAELDPGSDLAPVVIGARSAGHEALRVAVRGTPPRGGGPGQPDLVDVVRVTLTSGRTSTIEVSTDTPVLYLQPGASVPVRVELFDRGGQPVNGETPTLSVDHGRIGAPRPLPGGGYIATYTPEPDAVPREVTITARAGSGSAVGTVVLRLTPPPVRVAIGASVGGITNLSGLNSLYVSIDADVRLPVDPFFLRIGLSGYSGSRTVVSSLGTSLNRITPFPVTLATLYRPHRGRVPLWLGLGAQVAPYYATSVFNGTPLPARQGALGPGLTAIFGAGYRLGPYELMGEFRPSLISGSSRSGLVGQLGGLSLVLGFRAVID